jgi:hypothetical protein
MKSGASELLFFYTECTKTHLQAFTGQKIFPGALPPDPPGYGEGEGKGGEEGREGKRKRARGWKGEGGREGGREKGPGREGRERTGATAPQVSNPVHAPENEPIIASHENGDGRIESGTGQNGNRNSERSGRNKMCNPANPLFQCLIQMSSRGNLSRKP